MGQPARSPWRGVEDLTWSQDKGHRWIEAVGLWGRSLPLSGACCSLSLRAKKQGCPFLLAMAAGRAPRLGVSPTPWGCRE